MNRTRVEIQMMKIEISAMIVRSENVHIAHYEKEYPVGCSLAIIHGLTPIMISGQYRCYQTGRNMHVMRV